MIDHYVTAMIDQYYTLPGNSCGGNLHIVLDDRSMSRDAVSLCLRWAQEDGDWRGRLLAEALLMLPDVDRMDTIDPEGAYHRMGTTEEVRQ